MSKIILASEQLDVRRGIDHIGVTVCFVIHDGQGNVLLQKRSQNCRDERGTWDVGGGAIEFGESFEDAVKREVKEELGVDTTEIKFLIAYDAHRKNHEGASTHWVALGHAVMVDPARVKIAEPHKVDEIGWFTSKNLPAPLHSQMLRTLEPAIKLGIVI